jgi:chromosome segregation ATPase
MLREREEPQDRLLLQQANAKVQGAVAHVAELERRVGELEQQLTELQSARDQLTHRESEIRQSAEQAEARVQTLTAQIGSLAETDEQHRREIAQLIGNVRSNEIEAAAAKRRYDDEVAVLTTMLQQSEDRATTAEEGQAKGSREIRALSERVKELEAAVDELAGFARWSEQVRACLASQPAWWRFMPLAWRKKRERRRLRSARLFDSQAYHRRYPDVVAGGLDAIDHYFRHGVHEGRSRDF